MEHDRANCVGCFKEYDSIEMEIIQNHILGKDDYICVRCWKDLQLAQDEEDV